MAQALPSDRYKAPPTAAVRLPGIDIQLINYQWPSPHRSTDAMDGHTLVLSLSALPHAAHAQLEDLNGPVAGELGQLVFLPSRTPLTAWHNGGAQTILRCRYSEARFRTITGHKGDWNVVDLARGLNINGASLFSDMMRMADELLHGSVCNATALNALAELAAVNVMRHLSYAEFRQADSHSGGMTGAQLIKLRDRIQSHRLPFPQVGDLARELGLSTRHLSRIFKQETGTSIAQHLQVERRNRAVELLKDSDLPVKVIAARLGYQSASHFSAVFRDATGWSPREFRRRR